MNEKSTSSNLVSIALVVVAIALGYHLASNYPGSPRPTPLETGSSGQQNSHKVEFRLWQDPFEPFEVSTNPSSLVKTDAGVTRTPPLGSTQGQPINPSNGTQLGAAKLSEYSLSNDIKDHIADARVPTAILAIMLEGGSYAEDKEVRLRLRYAVELALLTAELGPEDRTHIYTNALNIDGIRSDFSYEWFKSRSDTTDGNILVLWLKEDDFSDNPARRLNALVQQIPFLTDSNRNVSFFLIGPRSSDTLRAFDSSLDDKSIDLIRAAKAGHFKILSPEATAIVHPTDYFKSWEFTPDAIRNLKSIVQKWAHKPNTVSSIVWRCISQKDQTNLLKYADSNRENASDTKIRRIVVEALNYTIDHEHLNRLPLTALPPETTNLAPMVEGEQDARHFNCLVLEKAYPDELSMNLESDPYGIKLRQEFDTKFHQTNVFHSWIATDQRLAELIIEELANRVVAGPLEQSSNVVVIISEQDTYFGSRLADEWSDALVGNGVCASYSDIWQFAYLRGLDGSKPTSQKLSAGPIDLSVSPEKALETVEQQQQQNGLRADGNAQMDYIARLGDLLHEKDQEMKRHGAGRIIGVGLTGSDAYDKLILLREMSRRLPEAVFFTTDLDAPLWTKNLLPCTRNLLVASAYPINPIPASNGWPLLEEFPPFRDVYQSAVYHACNAVVTNLWNANSMSDVIYDVPINQLKGTLWEIGQRGPVPLKPSLESLPPASPGRLRHLLVATRQWLGTRFDDVFFLWWTMTPAFGLIALGLITTRLKASSNLGFRWPNWGGPELTGKTSLIVRIGRALARSALALTRTALALAENEAQAANNQARIAKEEAQNASKEAAVLAAITVVPTGSFPSSFTSGTADADSHQTSAESVKPKSNPVEQAQCTALRQQLSFLELLGLIAGPAMVGLLVWAFLQTASGIAGMPGEEPWDFLDGVSIWPSECLRLIIIIGSFAFLWLLSRRLVYHRRRLWMRYFIQSNEEECSDDEWNAFWAGRESQWHASGHWFPFRRENSLMAGWIPPFVETVTNHKTEASVDMASLFDRYLRLGRVWLRIRRTSISVILYLCILGSIICSLHDVPTFLLIRGYWSHVFDQCTSTVTIIMVLAVLFYMLDAALLTKRILNCISAYPTRWPERPLRTKGAEFSVNKEHLDGFLDVEFAAIHTQELGMRMFGPFVLLLLLVISRWSVFDNWTWPIGLIIIFVMNFGLGVVCWAVVRHAAEKTRQFALARIELAKSSVKNAERAGIELLGPEGLKNVSKKEYLASLESVRHAIVSEKRGAYARAFRDPSYLGVCIPSGISGIVPLISWWLNK